MSCDGLGDFRVVGSDDDLRRAARARALGNAHHHGLAAQVNKRLAREAGRAVARRDDYGKLQRREW